NQKQETREEKTTKAQRSERFFFFVPLWFSLSLYIMKNRVIIAILLASLLAGCKVGPNYKRPDINTPAVYRGTADPNQALDPTSIGDLKWFELFKDPELQALVRAGLLNNFDIRNAIARVSAAHANLGITRSQQFPNIDASTSITTFRTSS